MRVSAYVHMRRDTPLSLYAPVHIFDDPSPFPHLRTYLMDGLFLNEKTNNNIHWNININSLKKKLILYEKKKW